MTATQLSSSWLGYKSPQSSPAQLTASSGFPQLHLPSSAATGDGGGEPMVGWRLGATSKAVAVESYEYEYDKATDRPP